MSDLKIAENASAPATPASGYGIIYPKSDGLWYSKDDAGVETLLSKPNSDLSKLTLDEAAAPSTPAASKGVIYVKSDGLFYSKDDAGQEYQLSFVSTIRAAWTPAFAGSTTAGVFTYVTQVGYYTRIGSMLFAFGSVQISAIGTPPVGNMRITGLPIAAANVGNLSGSVNFALISNINYAASALDLTGLVNANTSYVELFESFDNAGTANMPAANFTNVNARLIFTAIYNV